MSLFVTHSMAAHHKPLRTYTPAGTLRPLTHASNTCIYNLQPSCSRTTFDASKCIGHLAYKQTPYDTARLMYISRHLGSLKHIPHTHESPQNLNFNGMGSPQYEHEHSRNPHRSFCNSSMCTYTNRTTAWCNTPPENLKMHHFVQPDPMRSTLHIVHQAPCSTAQKNRSQP